MAGEYVEYTDDYGDYGPGEDSFDDETFTAEEIELAKTFRGPKIKGLQR